MSNTEKFLSDYTLPTHSILSCDLKFIISDEYTIVENTIQLQGNNSSENSIILDGIDLELIEISLDGKILSSVDYSIDTTSLTLNALPEIFTLSITTKIYPETNTALEGLFKSGSIYCTQNEPEGFRKITYFLDRPDVMTVFTTTIIASKKYPILLSNGNMIDSWEIDENIHFTKWNDPFKKPSYLFALVAGDLGKISDTFTTMSGKVVDLHIFSEHGNESRCLHAMESLKKSMKWDEDTYGREYDLGVFHIVAVDSFNMGAMENKSLNIFNTIYVLADIESATDKDFLGVESVIWHEYFHNWTGNRITCRDWFQLTLKEWLTVFRDHDFSGDMNSRHTMRIEDIRDLREFQFAEDAGPTAHPIQPASYKEMNNFYTATVYEKGSEVIRMMATLLGKEKFRKAMDLYFDTFDGQAVRTQDFVWAMATGWGIDLAQFEETWYHQERTPGIKVTTEYDRAKKTYSVNCIQVIEKNTRGQEQKPFYYPLAIALFAPDGTVFDLELTNNTFQNRIKDGILIISKSEEKFVFKWINQEPKISLNRSFSAPIRVHCDTIDPVFLMQYETDGFARYEAAQEYTINIIRSIMDGWVVSLEYLSNYASILVDSEDRLYQSILIQIPSLNVIAGAIGHDIDFDRIQDARDTLIRVILDRYTNQIQNLYRSLRSDLPKVEKTSAHEIGTRAYMNSLLDILSYSQNTDEIIQLAEIQYCESRTMTLRLGSLAIIDRLSTQDRHPYIQEFIDQFGDNSLVMMKYFAIVGSSSRDNIIERMKIAQQEAFYDKLLPNHAKSLFGSFARNLELFHKKDGSGYHLLTDFILDIDSINPHTAARMSGSFKIFPKLNPESQHTMRSYLEKILQKEWLSKNTEEIIDKILNYKQ
jgi:aminopeptidase N